MDTKHLWDALAAILNALDEANQSPIPVTSHGHSSVNGEDWNVYADRTHGRWVVSEGFGESN